MDHFTKTIRIKPLSIIALSLLIVHAQCIMWYMEPNTRKCLKEEIQGKVLVSGEYEVSEVPGQKVDFIVSFFYKLCFLQFFRLYFVTYNMLRFPFVYHCFKRFNEISFLSWSFLNFS